MDMNDLLRLFESFSAKDIAANVLAFEAPIPDAAVIGIFAILSVATFLSQRKAMKTMRRQLEAAFSEELVLANRRADHARSDLSKAKREMEHSRQRKRGLERSNATPEKPKVARPVSMLREVTANAAARG